MSWAQSGAEAAPSLTAGVLVSWALSGAKAAPSPSTGAPVTWAQSGAEAAPAPAELPTSRFRGNAPTIHVHVSRVHLQTATSRHLQLRANASGTLKTPLTSNALLAFLRVRIHILHVKVQITLQCCWDAWWEEAGSWQKRGLNTDQGLRTGRRASGRGGDTLDLGLGPCPMGRAPEELWSREDE